MRTPIKIAYIIGQLTKGGAEGQLYELLKHLDRDKFQPFVCSLSDGGYWAGPIRELGIEVVELKLNMHYDLGRLFKLYKLLKQWNPDIVHTMLTSGNMYGRLAALFLKNTCFISSERGLNIRKGIAMKVLDKFLDTFTSSYLTNSKCVAEHLKNSCGFSENKIRVIYNGINLNRYDGHKPDNTILGNKQGEITIGTICRLSKVKDIGSFLKAAKIVSEQDHNITFMIVGDGPQRKELESMSKNLSISDKVIFMGMVHDIPQVLSEIDVVVLSSLTESLPNVILEAMAASKPVVATNVGGCPELVVDNETGILVPPGQPEKLAEAILRISSDIELAERMGKAGRIRAEKNFYINKMVLETEKVYMELMGLNNNGRSN